MQAAEILIDSENAVWSFLDSVLKDGVSDSPFEIVFKDWPVLNIKVIGEKYSSTINATIMEGLVEFQKSIYRSYAKAKYNKEDARCLTKKEKEELDFYVKISEGSSDYKISLQEILNNFVKGISSKMESKHLAYTIIGIAIVMGASASYNDYLDHKLEEKKLDTQSYSSELETKRMEIFANAMKDNKVVQSVKENTDEARDAFLKSSVSAEKISIGGSVIDQDTVSELVKSSRDKSIDIRLDGYCRILSVDSSKAQNFTVKVEYEDGRIFNAVLEDKFIARKEKNKSLIQAAEWDKQPIFLAINAKEVRDQITKATIIDVTEEQGEKRN